MVEYGGKDSAHEGGGRRSHAHDLRLMEPGGRHSRLPDDEPAGHAEGDPRGPPGRY
jgi:hypothetical protein